MSFVGIGVGISLAGAAGWQVFDLWREGTIHQRRTSRLWQQVGQQAERSIEEACQTAIHESLIKRQATAWRTMEVSKIVEESDDCRSFYLTDANCQPLPTFMPGQYIIVRPVASAGTTVASRCYSLSDAPNPNYYRITVKRVSGSPDISGDAPGPPKKNLGFISHFLHDNISEGDCIQVRGPSGEFYLHPSFRGTLTLLAVGIGVTPIVSIAKWSLRNCPGRPIHIYYQSRNSRLNPLADKLYSLANDHAEVKLHRYFSRPTDRDVFRADYDHQGYINIANVLTEVPADSGFYFCGPEPWMQEVSDMLTQFGVAENRIHWESFGGAQRSKAKSDAIPAETSPNTALRTGPLITFKHSEVAVPWNAAAESLLELAENSNVLVAAGCRMGACGSCVVNCRGNVEYNEDPACSPGEGEVALCVAKPTGPLEIDA